MSNCSCMKTGILNQIRGFNIYNLTRVEAVRAKLVHKLENRLTTIKSNAAHGIKSVLNDFCNWLSEWDQRCYIFLIVVIFKRSLCDHTRVCPQGRILKRVMYLQIHYFSVSSILLQSDGVHNSKSALMKKLRWKVDAVGTNDTRRKCPEMSVLQ